MAGRHGARRDRGRAAGRCLEFPLVVLWDSRAPIEVRDDRGVWRVDPVNRGWMLAMHQLHWEHGGTGLLRRELEYRNHERRRLVYVAATRARDRLVVARATSGKPSYVNDLLLAQRDPALVTERETYRDTLIPAWAVGIEAPPSVERHVDETFEESLRERWIAAARTALEPRLVPVAVTAAAHGPTSWQADDEFAPRTSPRTGRFGPRFGDIVHRAIGIALASGGLSGRVAVARAAGRAGVGAQPTEAADDVDRACAALRAEGLLRPPGPTLRLEYPIAGALDPAELIHGFIDLIAVDAESVVVLDFKTDAPPLGGVDRRYARQIRAYAELVRAAGLVGDRRLRYGLLYTADGRIRWLDGGRDRGSEAHEKL